MQNKISRRQFLQVTGASAAALLLAGLPVEASAASGHLTVTPDTLVSDLRADPTFAASGVWTWQSEVLESCVPVTRLTLAIRTERNTGITLPWTKILGGERGRFCYSCFQQVIIY